MRTEEQIASFWFGKQCRPVPFLPDRKIRDYVKENEHLMFKLESMDIWIHVKLFMVQGKYNIDAEMDLKIEKQMPLKDFKCLQQKLALQMWN